MLAALSLCLPPALLRDLAVVDVCHCVATLLQTTPCIPPATTLGLSGTLSRGRRHAVATRKRCPLRPRCGEPARMAARTSCFRLSRRSGRSWMGYRRDSPAEGISLRLGSRALHPDVFFEQRPLPGPDSHYVWTPRTYSSALPAHPAFPSRVTTASMLSGKCR